MFNNSKEPEHRQQLRGSVADYIERSVSSKDIREAITSNQGFSHARWKEMAKLGWTSLLLPETFGGLEMQYGDLAALHTEIGRAPLPEPLAIIPLLVGQALAHGENSSLANRIVPDLSSGNLIATLAWQGSLGAIGANDVVPEAQLDGRSWRLSGEALFVPCAEAASSMIVAAKADNGSALFWLDELPTAIDVARHADGSSLGSITFNGISVPAEALIAGPESGGAILESVLDTARLAACAELLGIMERSLEMTLEHLRQRQQFGKPIGSFQALQHRAVDLYIQIELSRSAIDRAVRAFDDSATASNCAAQVSAAKSRCGDAARLVMKECIQMHGAIGYTSEYNLSLFVNRTLFLSSWLGNPSSHRQRWAKLSAAGESAHGN